MSEKQTFAQTQEIVPIDERSLSSLRKHWPIKNFYWGKKDCLVISEAILLQYDIEPSKDNPYVFEYFEDFLEFGDVDHIWELLDYSITNKSFSILMEGDPLWDSIIDTKQFCLWLVRKKIAVAPVFEHMLREILPKKTKMTLTQIQDVKKINFNKLPISVLKALGANVIAQIQQKICTRKGETPKQTKAINSLCMKKFIEMCAEAEAKPTMGEDTIRDYIEGQFQ
jgi:hypothetical protein